MYIDFDKLKRERKLDPFSCPPIDIAESVGFTGEVMRDNARTEPEVLAAKGAAACRVTVRDASPRLLQLLAILGWMPLDPTSDDVWFVDEPIEFASSDNYLVSTFVGQYYAEGMNLLFAPDDGMFDGGGYRFGLGADATRVQMRDLQKLMIERAYVTCAMRGRHVPVTILADAGAKAIQRQNLARVRCGLPTLANPGRGSVSRWKHEFDLKHGDRPGLHRRWRNHLR